MSEIIYMDDNLRITFKPTSQLYPYVWVVIEDEFDGDLAGCEFDDPEILEKIGESFLIASKKLKEKLEEANENT